MRSSSDELLLEFPRSAPRGNGSLRHASSLSAVPIDNFFPEIEANKLGVIESFNKHLFRPNTYLHKWWARRSGSTFRFILKQLVPRSESRDYFTPGGLEGAT